MTQLIDINFAAGTAVGSTVTIAEPPPAPVLSAPTATTTGATTASLGVTTNTDTGMLYWSMTTSSTAPSAAQVKAGQDHTGAAAPDSGSQAVSASGAQSISGGAAGLTASTVYYAHFMHEASGQSTVASSASITTNPLWTFVGVTSVFEVTAAALTMSEPAGCATGDLLVACIASRTSATTAPTLPSGWATVNSRNNNNVLTTGSALSSASMSYIVRGGSAPSFAFTLPAGISVALGRVAAYRGSHATPLDVTTAVTTAASTTAVSVAGLTTTGANELIVAMAAGGQEAAWTSFNATSPSGASGATDTASAPSTTWRERADSVTTTNVDTSLGIFDAIKTAAGATGNLTVTASVAAGHSVIAGAFKVA